MLLGDVIASLHDEPLVSETLLSLGDLALTARVVALGTASNASAGELAFRSVDRFLNNASDEEWLSLFGQMPRSG